MGLGSAYVEGFKSALDSDAQVIFEMDADLSHDPKYIPKFLSALKHSDVVRGTRYSKGGRRKDWPLHRTLISGGANILIRLIAALPVRDVTTGYRVYKREVLEKIDLDKIHSKGYEFQLEMLFHSVRHGFKVETVPMIFVSRTKGKSKLSLSDIANFFPFGHTIEARNIWLVERGETI